MKTTTILIAFTLFLCFSCASSKNQTHSGKMMKGTIISENFVNKGGKEISTVNDLYFKVSGDDTYFIKFTDESITFEAAEKLINKEITIQGEIKDGMWDVPDDNPAYAQSRTGLYLLIYSIEDK